MSDEVLDPVAVELENQLRRLETIADPAARSTATDLVASVLQFHTAALERMLELVANSESAVGILAGFDRDPLIRSVLLVHDLHPDSLNARVRRALEELEPLLRKREATLDLIAADGGLVRVKINGGHGHHPLAPAVEQALRNAAPDAVQVIVEEASVAPAAGFVSLEALQNSSPTTSAGAAQK